MKNIFTILEDLGIQVEDDKRKDLEKNLNENYKTINEYNSIKDNVEQLKNDLQTRDDDIESLTKKLEEAGEDKEKIAQAQDELKAYKKKYQEQTEEYENNLKKQEYEFAVREYTNTLAFTSNAGKKTFIQDLMEKELPLGDDGNLLGVEDFVKDYKEKDAGVFANDKGKAGNFGGKSNASSSKTTKEDIMKIEDRAERQEAIAENLELFE